MSRQQIEKLIKFSERQYEHGQWAKFALAEGLTKDSVFHWRKKLGLGLRSLKSANAVNVTAAHPSLAPDAVTGSQSDITGETNE